MRSDLCSSCAILTHVLLQACRTPRIVTPPPSLSTFKTKEAGYELDWSVEDRRSLDNFIVGRCIRRSVLDEAFTWLPDPVADALAKVTPRPPPPPPKTLASPPVRDTPDLCVCVVLLASTAF